MAAYAVSAEYYLIHEGYILRKEVILKDRALSNEGLELMFEH